jgi:hypothetical protein
MAKQTAVDWLADKLDELIPFVNKKTAINFNKLVKQAKEMEKQQMMDAWQDAIKDTNYNILDGEDYYNKTYQK